MTRTIAIEDMPKKYQIQFPRGVRDLVADLREVLAGIEAATEADAWEAVSDLSIEIRDKRLGIYGEDCRQITYERHLDWQTHIERAAISELSHEFGW